jgi:glutamine amidotransferase
MLDVIDYGAAGNLGSVCRALHRLGVKYQLVSAQTPPTGNNPLVFPGVGAFGAVMAALRTGDLDQTLVKLVKQGTPYLGICLGLQVLFDSSEETPDCKGLGLLPGKVIRYDAPKVPQVGWNWVESSKSDWPAGYVYFVNSFYPQPDNPEDALYKANYHTEFVAAVQHKNITAFQFHPEKSGPFGQKLLQQWLSEVSV